MNLPWREDKIQVISGLDSATSAIYGPILSRLQRVEDRLLTLRNDSLPDLDLLIKHIESRVRWRESVEYMIKNLSLIHI